MSFCWPPPILNSTCGNPIGGWDRRIKRGGSDCGAPRCGAAGDSPPIEQGGGNMQKLTLSGLALAIAAFFGMVQFSAPAALARSQAAAQTAPAGQSAQPPATNPYHVKVKAPQV